MAHTSLVPVAKDDPPTRQMPQPVRSSTKASPGRAAGGQQVLRAATAGAPVRLKGSQASSVGSRFNMKDGPGFFVLHEFRLPASDASTRQRAAASLAEMPRAQNEQVLPMLVSIDDHRDVACVRRVRALPGGVDEAGERIREALTPEAESSRPPRYYKERAALAGEREDPSYYRMAVTESGINEQPAARTLAGGPTPARGETAPPRPSDATGVALLWIGTPCASAAGLLVITGHHDGAAYLDSDPGVWPPPTSRQLGVRIYEGGSLLVAPVGRDGPPGGVPARPSPS